MTIPLTSPAQVREDVDRLLAVFYEERIAHASQMHPRYAKLWQVMYEVYKAGGKRNRPYEVVLTYQLLGGDDYKKVVPIAAATELFHTGILALDDVIDRDYMRHGQPNVAGRYLEEYKAVLTDEVDRKHYADAAGLQAESLLITASQSLIYHAPISEAERLQLSNIFFEAIFTVAGGELLDVEAPFVMPADKADWRTVAQYKTADYSFIMPMMLGATLAGASPEQQQTIRKLGSAMGIAFQLADDLLGIFSDEVETGKPEFSDIQEGKLTYPMITALEQASESDATWLKQLLGAKPVRRADGKRVRLIVEQSGAKAATEAMIAEYVAEAKQHLAQLQLTHDAEEVLSSLIDKVAWRSS